MTGRNRCFRIGPAVDAMRENPDMILGIDASNIRAGGGLTHLSCLLDAVKSGVVAGFRKIIVWGGKQTLERLTGSELVELVHVPTLDMPLPVRMIWQRWILPGCLLRQNCDVLFSPGGVLPAKFDPPAIVMSQNLLPFEKCEYKRFSLLSFMRWKMLLVRLNQQRSMTQADGLIFLTGYACDTVLGTLKRHTRLTKIIPHGIEQRFFCPPRRAELSENFTGLRPFRLLYVSTIDVYKHQWQVAEAVAAMRTRGIAVTIEFIGPSYGPALKKLTAAVRKFDPDGDFLHYPGAVPFAQLHDFYQRADAFVFASSCENLPNILLEAMAAGLPIACSRRGPMPEVLGDCGVYFDPERPEEISAALLQLYENTDLRQKLAQAAFNIASAYSWERCAQDTLQFIKHVARKEKTLSNMED